METQIPDNPEIDDNDADSAFDDHGTSNLSTSLKSSILNYKYDNGRRYHAFREGEYPLPNDEAEQDRMDFLHHIWRMIVGGDLLRTKIDQPQRILDVGTGTGIWAIDVADLFPEALVIGIDLSPIQPSWVPPNVKFYVDDAESEWNYEPFDLIHGRSLCGGIADWPKFYRQCYTQLKPGAYLEMQEHDAWISSIGETPPWTAAWNVTLNEASDRFGKSLHVANYHAGWMRDAGFVDIVDQAHKIPVGPWAKDKKEIGRFHLAQMLEAVEPYTLTLYTKVLGKSLEETKIAIEMVLNEFRDKRNHLYINYHFITARKPESTVVTQTAEGAHPVA